MAEILPFDLAYDSLAASIPKFLLRAANNSLHENVAQPALGMALDILNGIIQCSLAYDGNNLEAKGGGTFFDGFPGLVIVGDHQVKENKINAIRNIGLSCRLDALAKSFAK